MEHANSTRTKIIVIATVIMNEECIHCKTKLIVLTRVITLVTVNSSYEQFRLVLQTNYKEAAAMVVLP